MRIANLSPTLVTLYNNEATRKRAVFLIGASGIGKSEVLYQTGVALGNLPVIDQRLSQMDSTDLRGVPSVLEHRTHWNVPSFFPTEETPNGILFLDEITSCPPSIQAAAYQLILERRLGDYKLPDGWMVVAAGNRMSDRGVTFQLAAPLLNRMTKIEVDTVLDDWIEHAAVIGVRPEIMAFLSDRADYLHKFDPKESGEQFPSPRGWVAASHKLDLNLDPALRVELLKGDVGQSAAVDFEQFLRVYETMPSLNQIFSDPDSVEVPAKLDVRFCVTMGLAARMDKKNFANAWKFLQRMPKENQTLSVKLAYKRDNTLVQSPEFSQWALENQDAFRRV